MRTSRLCSLWPDMRPLRFRRVPFGRDVAFDPGGATASRIAMPHMLPSTVPSVSASAKLLLSWLNPPPHPITVYASHPPSPTTAQHSLPGGALPPYRGRSFTGRIASASPDAPELEVQIHLPPAVRWYGAGGEGGRASGFCHRPMQAFTAAHRTDEIVVTVGVNDSKPSGVISVRGLGRYADAASKPVRRSPSRARQIKDHPR